MDDRVPIRIGTRASALALVQARWVAGRLEEAGTPTILVLVRTAGDLRAPDSAWGEGAFVTAIEAALLDDRIDVAVHSANDVPTAEDPRLVIAVGAGARATQVFDSWAGGLSPFDYDRSVLPWMRRLFDGLRPLGVPTIHCGGHVFDLGHGVPPGTDPDDLARLVDLVHEATADRAATPWARMTTEPATAGTPR